MTVISTMSLTAGTLNTNAVSVQPIAVGGSWLNAGGLFTMNTSTVIFNATSVASRFGLEGSHSNQSGLDRIPWAAITHCEIP